MSTNFNTDFDDGDVIFAEHVEQFAQPINALESGQAWYREDIGSGDAYKVDFSTDNVIDASDGYTPGLMVHFKAQTANTGAATLTVQGSDGLDPPGAEDLDPVPLVKKGGTALDTGDIMAGQVVVAVYTEDSGGTNPRFEVIAGAGSIGGGGGGAEELDDLDDVTITSPASGQVIRYNGTTFVNAGLGSALDAIAGLSMAKGDILVHNGTQLTKMSPGTNGQLLSADSAQTTGLSWVTSSGGGGSPTGTANKVAYFNSSGALASTTNLSFNASNTQMGVGPDTPISTLHISSAATGAANGTTGIVVSRGGEYLNLEAGPSGDSHVGTSTPSAFSLRTSNYPRFTLNSSGKCTLFPEIVGGQQLRLTGYAYGAVNGTKGIELEVTGGTEQVRMEVGASNDSYVGTVGSSSFSLRTSNTARFTLNSSGYCTLFPRIVGGQQLKLTGYANGAVDGTKGIELEIPGWDSVKMEVGASNDSYLGTLGPSSFSLRTSDTARFTINGSGKCTRFPGLSEQKISLDFASSVVNNGSKGIEIINGGHYVRMEAGASDDSYVGTATNSDFHLRRNDANLVTLRSGRVELLNNIGLRFNEATSNGSNYVELRSPAALSSNVSLTLPDTAGTAGQFLKSDGSGNMSWSNLQAPTVTAGSGSFVSGSSSAALSCSYTSGGTTVTQPWLTFDALSGGRTGVQGIVFRPVAGLPLYRDTDTGELHHQSSSAKFKRNIRSMESVSKLLEQLRPVRFEGAALPFADSTAPKYAESYGLIAEEVAEVLPDLCYSINGGHHHQTMGVYYDRIGIYLLAGWREQQQELHDVRAELQDAKARLVALEGARN